MIFKIIENLLTIVLCGYLKNRGEVLNHNFQRFVLPIVYAFSVSLTSWCWWVGLTCLPMIAAITFPYSLYGKNDALARALWLGVICLVGNLGVVVTGHLAWWIVLIAFLISAGVGCLTRNQNNKWGSWVNGIAISWPILFVHM